MVLDFGQLRYIHNAYIPFWTFSLIPYIHLRIVLSNGLLIFKSLLTSFHLWKKSRTHYPNLSLTNHTTKTTILQNHFHLLHILLIRFSYAPPPEHRSVISLLQKGMHLHKRRIPCNYLDACISIRSQNPQFLHSSVLLATLNFTVIISYIHSFEIFSLLIEHVPCSNCHAICYIHHRICT